MDKLGVINLALLKVALPLAANLEDCDYNASMIFDNVADQNLKLHAWGFAQKFAILEEARSTPAFGYPYAYLKPADCVRIIDVRQDNDLRAPRARMSPEGALVFTTARPCYARYVWRCLDPQYWPADFTDAVACHIACEIAGLSGEKIALVPQLYQLYTVSVSKAMANDAREVTDRVPLDESLYRARSQGQQG